MPKPPNTAPPPKMLVMSQKEANKAFAGLQEQYTDAMVITVDAVDVTAAMLEGLKFKENMDLVSRSLLHFSTPNLENYWES